MNTAWLQLQFNGAAIESNGAFVDKTNGRPRKRRTSDLRDTKVLNIDGLRKAGDAAGQKTVVVSLLFVV